MSRIWKVKNFIFFLLLPFMFFGQTNEESEYYDWFDRVINIEHIGLYNGKRYIDLNINKILDNKHALFKSEKAFIGSVTYSGQTYYNVKMKYNLENDQLLVTRQPGALYSVLQLIRDKVDTFSIDDHKFVRIDGFIENNTSISGFHEVLLENTSFSLLKRHKKFRKEKLGNLDQNTVYYEFASTNNYIVLTDQNYKKITSKSDIIKTYPDLKKEIKQFYSTNKRFRKSQPDKFILGLFEKVIQPSVSKNNL